MTINTDVIKEISIKTHCSYYDGYVDLLRISPNWISYKREAANDFKTLASWSYQSGTEIMAERFGNLCHEVSYRLSDFKEDTSIHSIYELNIRINYRDGTHIDIGMNGSLAENSLSDISEKIMLMIPPYEKYPDAISMFKTRELTKEILDSLDSSSIIGYMCSAGSAVSDPGETHVITSDHEHFYLDDIYPGTEREVNESDIEKLIGLEGNAIDYHYNFLPQIVKGKHRTFVFVYLGSGFYLFLDDRFYIKFRSLISAERPDYMYCRWLDLIVSPVDEEYYRKAEDKKGSVVDLSGDALENDCDVLCHQVNLFRTMGAGIALQIKERFPEVYKQYKEYPNDGLGEVCFAKSTEHYVIANCFSQKVNGDTDYHALEQCLDKVVQHMKDNGYKSVAIPYKYGCGIANGDWNKVRQIFEDKFKGFVLKIYKL